MEPASKFWLLTPRRSSVVAASADDADDHGAGVGGWKVGCTEPSCRSFVHGWLAGEMHLHRAHTSNLRRPSASLRHSVSLLRFRLLFCFSFAVLVFPQSQSMPPSNQIDPFFQ